MKKPLALLAILVLSSVPSVVGAQYYPTLYPNGVLAFTNAERYKAGLPMLASNAQLTLTASEKLQDLFARQYFAHEAPGSGDTVSELAKRNNYAFLTVGENLALGAFTSNKHLVDSWMDSPGHRENILSPKYSEIGIAVGRGMYEGRLVWIAVQAFGLPKASCPGVDESVRAQLEETERRLKLLGIIADMRRDALEEDGLSRSEYNARVILYNKAAEVYNSYVAQQKKLVAQFNEGVDSFNTCIDEKLIRSKESV